MEKLPAQMTVIGISKPGGPEVLLPETRSVPTPGPNEILIKVAASGVNRPDVAQRPESGLPAGDGGEGVQQVAGGSGQPVEPRHGQHVARLKLAE